MIATKDAGWVRFGCAGRGGERRALLFSLRSMGVRLKVLGKRLESAALRCVPLRFYHHLELLRDYPDDDDNDNMIQQVMFVIFWRTTKYSLDQTSWKMAGQRS